MMSKIFLRTLQSVIALLTRFMQSVQRKRRRKYVEKELMDALYKKAVGYETSEIVEEYNDVGDIVKRKVSTKYIPPDVTALKIYVEESDRGDLVRLDDEELIKEKERLLKLLGEMERNETVKGKV